MTAKSILYRALTSVSTCLLFLPAKGHAQEDNAIDIEDIYRIELVVFADIDAMAVQAGGLTGLTTDTEQWHKPKDLSYPERLAFLRNVAPVVPSVVDDLAAAEEGEPAVEAEIIPPLLTTLERSQFSLAETAAALHRRSRFRVLYHQAWNQALTDRKQAPAIPLAAGERYDDWYELTGSVTFSKERFLHVTTDLWLSEFTYRNEFSEQRPWYAPSAAQQYLLPPLPSPQNPGGGNSREHDETGMYADANVNYKAERIYVLREYRRLRRDEIHYLDHPVFGVIVMVSKYQSPADN